MIICIRCGWVVPTDCTCRRQADELSAVRLERVVAARHRAAVARACRSGWAVSRAPVDPEHTAAG